MSKRSFAVISILSIVITFATPIIDVLINNNFVYGTGGFPLKFDNGFFGGTNYVALVLDIVFWFAIIFVVKKMILKKSKKK